MAPVHLWLIHYTTFNGYDGERKMFALVKVPFDETPQEWIKDINDHSDKIDDDVLKFISATRITSDINDADFMALKIAFGGV